MLADVPAVLAEGNRLWMASTRGGGSTAEPQVSVLAAKVRNRATGDDVAVLRVGVVKPHSGLGVPLDIAAVTTGLRFQPLDT